MRPSVACSTAAAISVRLYPSGMVSVKPVDAGPVMSALTISSPVTPP